MPKIIVKYYGDIENIVSDYPDTKLSILYNQYAIISIPEEYINSLAARNGIEYIERPRDLYFNVNTGKNVSCVNSVQVQNNTEDIYLTGKGVLIGIIDSGERVIIMSGYNVFYFCKYY